MMKTRAYKMISPIYDSPSGIPGRREYVNPLPIGVYSRTDNNCKDHLSAHRADYYTILLVTKGQGRLTTGTRSYYIDEPMIIFVHPSEVISWKELSVAQEGYACFFNRRLLDERPLLKTIIDKYHLFDSRNKNIIRMKPADVPVLGGIFASMQQEQLSGNRLNDDAIQTYLQLLLIQCARITDFKASGQVSEEHKHVHEFFGLLEREITNVNYTNPVSMKTAKEFAANLQVHPNYLNTLLKKHTGQNVSTHIRTRLLEQAKNLLLRTDWTLQDIGYCIGFAEQPNFSLFFKKNAGVTPAAYRKQLRIRN